MPKKGNSHCAPVQHGMSRRNALTLAAASALGAVGASSLRGRSLPTAPVDVRAFGAVCDGATDDAPAIQAALDSNQCVELPRGLYCIQEPLRISTGQVLLGCGSTLCGDGTDVGIQRGTDPRFGEDLIEFPVIRDLRLENFTVGLQAEGMSWGDFQNIVVLHCEKGFRLATGNRGTCYYNTFTSCHVVEGVDTGVLFEGMPNERFEDPETGIPVKGANGNLFQGCKIGGESICLDIHGPVTGLAFIGCSIERAVPGITLLDLGTTTDATDCQCEPKQTCGGDGICEKCKVRKVEFFGCNIEGGAKVDGVDQPGLLRVGQYAQDCSFFGCSIAGGVDVQDEGNLINWLPTQGCGGIHQFFALEPGNAFARIGNNLPGKLFDSVNARILRMDLGGEIEWRVPGSDPRDPADVALRRDAGSVLRTDQSFMAGELLGRAVAAHDDSGQPAVRLDGGSRRLTMTDAEGSNAITLDGTNGRVTARSLHVLGTAVESASVGDVLVISPNDGRMQRCSRGSDTRVCGVLAGLEGDLAEETCRRGEVACVGVTRCRVDAEYGAIHPGDLLTTSRTPGHAMRVSDPAKVVGAVLGKALEPLRRGRGFLQILVSLR
jgi:hypothetical protein